VEAVEVTDELEDILDRMEQQSESVALPKGTTARQFMQMVMRGELEPTPKQFSAAKALIEYEEPKLSAVAVGHFEGKDFASQLERALARSEAARNYVPRPALLPPPEHSADELKKPFVLRRRNFR
jgi:hypothetical protein